MKKADQYSCTSNVVKLLKHLDTLKNLQRGKVVPIMLHVMPTHRCQLNCIHCCFKNRKDNKADIDFNDLKTAFLQFKDLGTRAVEFTGGGDPSLYPFIDDAIKFLNKLRFSVGIITNGIKPIKDPDMLDWVRISLNTLDYRDKLDISCYKKSTASVTTCYIWNDLSDDNIEKIIDFSNKEQIICRVAPDCIKPLAEIEKDIDYIRNKLSYFPHNKYIFLSDFNIDTKRRNYKCHIHMIKPALYLDGYVYACPSAELAIENDKQIQEKLRICRFDEINDYYNGKVPVLECTCSYCKYTKQQELLEDLLMETEFNEFA